MARRSRQPSVLIINRRGVVVSGDGGGGGGLYYFNDDTERDDFFTANPDKLKNGLIIGVGDPIQGEVYSAETGTWTDIDLGIAFKGEAGDKGDPGAPGTPGAPGVKGIDGIDGIDGVDGVDGISFTFKGTKDSSSDLPDDPDDNDAWCTLDDGNINIWNGEEWVSSVWKGPKGDPGTSSISKDIYCIFTDPLPVADTWDIEYSDLAATDGSTVTAADCSVNQIIAILDSVYSIRAYARVISVETDRIVTHFTTTTQIVSYPDGVESVKYPVNTIIKGYDSVAAEDRVIMVINEEHFITTGEFTDDVNSPYVIELVTPSAIESAVAAHNSNTDSHSDKESKSNKVTSLTDTNTNEQYPTAKATYDFIQAALATVPQSLKVPIELDRESNLPVDLESVDERTYWLIEEMDVTKPFHSGKAWVKEVPYYTNELEMVSDGDNYFVGDILTYDKLKIEVTGTVSNGVISSYDILNDESFTDLSTNGTPVPFETDSTIEHNKATFNIISTIQDPKKFIFKFIDQEGSPDGQSIVFTQFGEYTVNETWITDVMEQPIINGIHDHNIDTEAHANVLETKVDYTATDNLDMAGHNIDSVGDVYTDGLHTDVLGVNKNGAISVDNNLVFTTGEYIQGLSDVTGKDDDYAANKGYVDTAVATKENKFIRNVSQSEWEAMVADPTLAEDGVEYVVDGLSKESMYHAVPDYSAKELIEHTSASGSLPTEITWTADRDGAIMVDGGIRFSSASSGTVGIICAIDQIDSDNVGGWRQTIYSTNSVTYNPATVTLFIKKGQVVRLRFRTEGTVSLGNPCNLALYYIPVVFVEIPKPNVVIQEGSDYSLDEQPVMIWDNGVMRQKKWVDGKPIFESTFTGTITQAKNTVNTVILSPLNYAESIISISGYWEVDDARPNVKNAWGCGSSVGWQGSCTVGSTGAGQIHINTLGTYDRTNREFVAAIQYTKP
jgi:hypothetical protein